MVPRKRKKIFLISAFLALAGCILCVFLFSPSYIVPLFIVSVPLYFITFFLLFLFLYSFTAYLFRSFIHGILVGLFPVVYLIMRLNDLTAPLFFVLLAGIFVVLEILLVQLTKKH